MEDYTLRKDTRATIFLLQSGWSYYASILSIFGMKVDLNEGSGRYVYLHHRYLGM